MDKCGSLITPSQSAIRKEERTIKQMSSNPDNMTINAIGWDMKKNTATLSMGFIKENEWSSKPAFYIIVPFVNGNEFRLNQRFNSLPENYKTLSEVYTVVSNETVAEVFRRTSTIPVRLKTEKRS